MPHIYIDCVEFYSEKLIATYLTLCLSNIIKKICVDNGLDRKLKKKFEVKICKSFTMLLDMLQALQETFEQAKKCGEFPNNDLDQPNLMMQLDFFFYIVLDNSSSVLISER